MLIREALSQGRDRLRLAGIDEAQVECEHMLIEILGKSRTEVQYLCMEIHSSGLYLKARDQNVLSADQEKQFILYLELEALKAGIAQYLGVDHPSVDADRCRITAIEHTEEYIEIALVILPPKELPKIVSCAKSTPDL